MPLWVALRSQSAGRLSICFARYDGRPKLHRGAAILKFNELGTLLPVRPYCQNDQYWQVYFDTNQVKAAVYADASYPYPFMLHEVKS
jgi:hypothetical protein